MAADLEGLLRQEQTARLGPSADFGSVVGVTAVAKERLTGVGHAARAVDAFVARLAADRD